MPKAEASQSAGSGGLENLVDEVVAKVIAMTVAADQGEVAKRGKGGKGQGGAAKGRESLRAAAEKAVSEGYVGAALAEVATGGKGKEGGKGKQGCKGKREGGQKVWPWAQKKEAGINTEAVIAKAAASVYKAISGAKKAEAVVEKAARVSAVASRQRVEEEGPKAGSAYKRMGGGKEGCTRVEEERSKAGSAYTRMGRGKEGATRVEEDGSRGDSKGGAGEQRGKSVGKRSARCGEDWASQAKAMAEVAVRTQQIADEAREAARSAYKRVGGREKEGCTLVEAEEWLEATSAGKRVGGQAARAVLLAKAAASGGSRLLSAAVGGIKRRRTDAKADVPTWLPCPAPQPITSVLLSVCFRKTCLWITSELLVCSSCALSILYAILGCVVRVCI